MQELRLEGGPYDGASGPAPEGIEQHGALFVAVDPANGGPNGLVISTRRGKGHPYLRVISAGSYLMYRDSGMAAPSSRTPVEVEA